jgi:hypothetical protein
MKTTAEANHLSTSSKKNRDVQNMVAHYTTAFHPLQKVEGGWQTQARMSVNS